MFLISDYFPDYLCCGAEYVNITVHVHAADDLQGILCHVKLRGRKNNPQSPWLDSRGPRRHTCIHRKWKYVYASWGFHPGIVAVNTINIRGCVAVRVREDFLNGLFM